MDSREGPEREDSGRYVLGHSDGELERLVAQARLVELARAIVDRPSLLLLDEPTSGLGEAESEVTAGVITAFRDAGGTVLLVEHDMPFVMAVCDRVTVLELGAVIAEGSPLEVQANELVRAAYLG